MADSRELVRRLRSVPATAARLREERKAISREIASGSRAQVLRLAQELIQGGAPRFVAYELVRNHAPTMSTLTLCEVERLGAGIGHWGDIDAFSVLIAGPAWRAGRIDDRAVQAWVRSKDWCWRRVALVSTVALNARAQGGSGDTRRAIAICRSLAADRHELVVKALSWSLRELSKRDPGSVRRFLAEHRDHLATLVIREVTHKMETGLKNPRPPGRNSKRRSG